MATATAKNTCDIDEMCNRIYQHTIDSEQDGIYLTADDVEYRIVWVPAEENWALFVTEDGKIDFWGFDGLDRQLESVSDDAIEAYYFDEVAENYA